jgi:hypothetical protein
MKQISSKGRRAFLKKAGTAAAAVPAAALLLSITHKAALAQSQSGGIVDTCEINPQQCTQ